MPLLKMRMSVLMISVLMMNVLMIVLMIVLMMNWPDFLVRVPLQRIRHPPFWPNNPRREMKKRSWLKQFRMALVVL